MSHARSRHAGVRRHQQGVVLLALVLVMLVGSSYLLLGKLNQRAQEYARDIQTRQVLQQAKQALIQYAITYPETHPDSTRNPGPGYLPCPDQDIGPDQGDGLQNDDMVAQSNCALGTGTTVGRLPTRDLGLEDLRDGTGERLWYAVDEQFMHNQSAGHVLNSETRAAMRLDASAEEIVAVIIAPGAPVGGQTGRATAVAEVTAAPTPTKAWHEVIDQYLEDDNATDTDGEFVTAPTVAGSPAQCTDGSLDDDEIEAQCFNDTVVTLTRAELMAAVEARVAGDVRAALAGWRAAAGNALPWLAAFTDARHDDPKRAGRYGGGLGGYGIAGAHTSESASSTVLTDSGARFVSLGAGVGDRVWNVTDGSFGTITAVTETSVTVLALQGGEDDDFAFQDRYYIEAAAPLHASLFTGAAAAASSATNLDATLDLEALGVVPGDVVDEIDGSGAIVGSGTVIAVDGNDVELDPGAGADFDPGDTYRVRSVLGVATGGSPTTLLDTNVDFRDAVGGTGVQAGDLVLNITDGSTGTVSVNPAAGDTVTVGAFLGGTNNQFNAGDNYALVRHLPETGVRSGLLAVHEMGKPFITDLSLQWSLLASNGSTLAVNTPGAATTYTTAVTNGIQRTTLYSDDPDDDASYPDAVNFEVGAGATVACRWGGVNLALCDATWDDTQFFLADVDSVAVAGSVYSITDTGSRFNYFGVRPGAKVQNLTQGSTGVVHRASSTTQNVMDVVPIDDWTTPFAAAPGDQLRVLVASKRTPASGSHVADGATAGNQVCTAGANFWSFVGAGDTIRLNSSTDGNPIGTITGAPSADCVTYTNLQGTGTTNTIALGQSYRILYDFVETRRWQARVRMAGTVVASNPAPGFQERAVCQGFNATCTTLNADPIFVADNLQPVVQFEDLDGGGNSLATASIVVPGAGTAQGSLRASGLTLLLHEDVDDTTDAGNLPRWFLRNRWHEVALVTYAEALSPTTAGDCVPGTTSPTNCLSIVMNNLPGVPTRADRRAVVLMAGRQLAGQDRSSGLRADYFENDNADTDDTFDQDGVGDAFNDRTGVLTE